MPASNYKPRVVLQFNEYDFRHRKVLEILRSNKRHMTDLVVNAILHFIKLVFLFQFFLYLLGQEEKFFQLFGVL